MISWLLIPLLWSCPSAKVPVYGTVELKMLADTPGKPLLCKPQAGAPERFDSLDAAMARLQIAGEGTALFLCQPGDAPCVRQSLTWQSVPVLKQIKEAK